MARLAQQQRPMVTTSAAPVRAHERAGRTRSLTVSHAAAQYAAARIDALPQAASHQPPAASRQLPAPRFPRLPAAVTARHDHARTTTTRSPPDHTSSGFVDLDLGRAKGGAGPPQMVIITASNLTDHTTTASSHAAPPPHCSYTYPPFLGMRRDGSAGDSIRRRSSWRSSSR